MCVCWGGGGVVYKRKFMVFQLKRLSTVSSKNKERKHKWGSWRRTLARIKRDRMNVLKTPHFWKIQTIRRLSRDGRTRHNSIVDETGSYFSTMYIVYFIISIFETWTVFPLFSLIFIRLPRVVITSSVAERRKRLEAIGWNSGYPLLRTLAGCFMSQMSQWVMSHESWVMSHLNHQTIHTTRGSIPEVKCCPKVVHISWCTSFKQAS